MDILWLGIEFLVTGVQILFILLIPVFQLEGLRKGVQVWHIAAYILISDITITIYNYLTANNVSSMYFFALFLIFIPIINMGKWFAKIFWMVFPISIYFIVELFVIKIILALNSISIQAIAEQTIYRLITMISMVSFEIIVLFLSKRFKLKIENESKFLIVPISISILLLPILAILGQEIWQIAISLILINVIYLLYIKINNQKQEHKHILEAKQSEWKKKNEEELDVLYSDLHEFQSQINDNLQVIQGLANLHKLPEVEEYLDQLKDINKYFPKIYNTGNHFIDSILVSKNSYAKKNDIEFKVNIDTPLDESLDYADVGNMIIHLIDSGFQAIDQIFSEDDADRTVKFSMLRLDNRYMITIENPEEGMAFPSQELLLAKENQRLSLSSVQEIAKKNNAKFSMDNNGGYFTACILLPI